MDEVLICQSCAVEFHQSFLSTHVEAFHVNQRHEDIVSLCCITCSYTVSANHKNSMIQHCFITGHDINSVEAQCNRFWAEEKTRVESILKIGLGILKQNMAADESDPPSNDLVPVFQPEQRGKKTAATKPAIECYLDDLSSNDDQANEAPRKRKKKVAGIKKEINDTESAEVIRYIMGNKNYNELSLAKKKELIEFAEEHPGVGHREMGRLFSCSKSQVQRILTRKAEYRSMSDTEDSKKRLNNNSVEVGQQVWEWHKEAIANNLEITNAMIREKAKEIGVERLHMKDFKASNGWLARYQRKYNLTSKYVHSAEGRKSIVCFNNVPNNQQSPEPSSSNRNGEATSSIETYMSELTAE